MKKTHVTLLTAAMLSLSSFAVADYAPSCETDTCIAPVTANANRVYVGPEFMWSHFNGDVEHEACDFSLKQNVYYGGLRFGYEFLQPDAFYANTDVVALLGTTHSTARNKEDGTKAWDRTKETFKGKRGHLWTNVEQRLGYTFASSLVPSATVSAYVAPGFHYEHVDGKHANWWYAATGLKTLQQFTDTFQLGLDLKVMYAFAAHDKEALARPTTLGRKQFFGYEVGVPLSWTLGACKTFDIQLKPYLLKLNVNSQETILGARAEFGFKF
jgi:hypothetical protein